MTEITIIPVSASIAKSTTQAFKAMGTFSDSTTLNMTTVSTWSSSNSKVATVSSGGIATGADMGSTTITAKWIYDAYSNKEGLGLCVNHWDKSVSVINTIDNTIVGSPISVGNNPIGIAITPNGAYAYVTNTLGYPGTVSVIRTSDNTVVGSPISVGNGPWGIVITP